MSDSVAIPAHAKINLFFRVLAKEESGFHSIETLFSLIELADRIEVQRIDSGIELEVQGADTGPPEENLAYRAAQEVLTATGNKFGVAIRIHKEIPVRAGLGGGSSDGAATLTAVNHLAENAIPRPELLQFAAKLGSDVPFLAAGIPMALAWGRGQRMFQVPAPPATPLLVAVPEFGVSTPEAYRSLDRARTSESDPKPILLDSDAFAGWGGIGRLGGNDFESVLFGAEPRLRELYEALAETRPLLVRLSGSGSAVVAAYRSAAELENAAMTINRNELRIYQTSTRSTPPAGIQTQT